MQYSITDLDKAIYSYLSCHPDTPQSVHQIFSGVCKEKICPDLENHPARERNKQLFNLTCVTLDSDFQNVHKMYIHGKMYLIFSADTKDVVLKKWNDDLEVVSAWDDSEDDIDYGHIIEQIINNPQKYTDFNVNDRIDGIDTPLHLLCREGKYDSIDKLLKIYDVELCLKDRKEKTPLEIAMERNDSKMIKLLMTYEYEQKLTDLRYQNEMLKKVNKDVLVANSKHVKNISNNMKGNIVRMAVSAICGYMIRVIMIWI
jgi:hypothetical protein